MRILIVEGVASSDWGGAEMSMYSYIKHLEAENNNIYLSYQKEGDWLNDKSRYLFTDSCKIDISSFMSQGLIKFVKNIIDFLKFAKNNDIEVILTHTIHGFVFLRLANLFIGKPLIVYFKWIYNGKSIGLINRWGAKGIDHAVYLESVVNYWKANNVKPRLDCSIIPDGIAWDENPRVCMNRKNSDRIVKLIFLGRIYPGKGLHLIIESMVSLPNAELTICGFFSDTEEHQFLEYHKLINHLISSNDLQNRVHFFGLCENPIEQICDSDLVIVPSVLFEAQGRVLLEAMATKTLVIATNTGGSKDVLGQYGEELLFEPTVKSLTSKIKEVILFDFDKKNKLKENLYNRFMKNYREEITHERLDAVLKVILSNN